MKRNKKETIEGEILSDDNRDYRSEFRKDNYHRGSGIGALLLIFIGLVLLFNNLGLIPWDIWSNIWRFWPLLIIFWGLQLIFGKSFLGNLITTLGGLLIIILILIIILGPQNLSTIIPPSLLNYLK